MPTEYSYTLLAGLASADFLSECSFRRIGRSTEDAARSAESRVSAWSSMCCWTGICMRYEMMEARRGKIARCDARGGGAANTTARRLIFSADEQPTLQHTRPRAFLLCIRTTPQSPLHYIIRYVSNQEESGDLRTSWSDGVVCRQGCS